MSTNGYVFDRYRKNRPIDIVNIAFLIFMGAVFPIYWQSKALAVANDGKWGYFNITGTKAELFYHWALIYAALIVAAVIIEYSMVAYYQAEANPVLFTVKEGFLQYGKKKDTFFLLRPELWGVLFFFAQFIAMFVATDMDAAFTGSNGRKMGFQFFIALLIAFLLLAKETNVNFIVFLATVGASAFCYILAIMQHFWQDPFGLREDVVPRQKEMFISTFGNINTYGSYIAVTLPIFVAVFIFCKKKWLQLIAGLMVILGGAAIIPTKSDNTYLGLMMAFLVIFYFAVWNKKIFEFFMSMSLMAVGLTIIAYYTVSYNASQKHINGVAVVVENPFVMLMLLLGMLVFSAIFLLFRILYVTGYEKFQGKIFLLIFTALLVGGGISVFVIGVKRGSSIFTFNDKWGTYRGYIWRKAVESYQSAPFVNKIFGFGNESVGEICKTFYNEMVAVTGKKYDNFHNEVLQYLLTTGLFGALSYVGMVFTSIFYMLRRAKGDAVILALAASGVGYFFSGLVTVSQPITAPFLYVVLGAGVGYTRYKQLGYGRFKKTVV